MEVIMARNSRDGYGFGLGGPTPALAPTPIISTRAPVAGDVGQELGTTWISTVTNQAWTMTGAAAGAATWSLSSPGASDVDTLTGDGGGAISPLAGNITVAGGTNITTAGLGNTITYNLDNAITLATSVTSPLYTAAANVAITATAGNDIVLTLGDAAGADNFTINNSAAAAIFNIDSLGAMGAMAGLVVTGAFTQTAGIVNIGADAAANAVNIATGGAAKVVTIGSVNGASSLDLLAGTANFSLEGNVATTYAISNVGVNTGQVDIAGGTGARNINIGGGGTGAKTLNICTAGSVDVISVGSVTAGAITVDTAAGISLDAATASNFTVTGAALDLTLASVGGSVAIDGSEALATAINLDASDAAGGITIAAGTGGLNFGNQADCTTIGLGDFAPTANRTITVGGGTVITAATTDLIDIGPDGATTNANSIKTVNVNTGGVTLGEVLTNIASGIVTSGTHTTAIATGNRVAGAMTLDLMTGTGIKTANVGNADALTTLNIDAITAINDNINAAFTACTGTSTGAVTIGNIATSTAMALQSSTTIDIDAAGAMTMNSTAGTINIGNDDVDQNMGFGTDGERVVTVGSVNGAAGLVLQAGTADITVTGTVQDMTANFVRETGDAITFRASPVAQSILDTCVIPTGVAATTDLLVFENGMIMEQFIIGTQTILAPRMGAAALGLTVSCDLTTAEGKEYNFGAARTSSKHTFTIGTSPAFYMQMRFTINDVSTVEPAYFGFRETAANNAAYAAYNEFCFYGCNDGVAPGDCAFSTRLAGGAVTNTDSNDAWVDGTTHTLRINVSDAGVCTFTFDGGAPTVAAAFTFTNGAVVHPCWTHLYNATVAAGDEIYWESMEVGFQA